MENRRVRAIFEASFRKYGMRFKAMHFFLTLYNRVKWSVPLPPRLILKFYSIELMYNIST